MTEIKKDKPYIKYAYDVIEGKIVACEYIIKACQRFINWFSRDDIYFDYDDIDKKIKFIYQMKHYQGKFNGVNFELMPWEAWVLANIWCWKYKEDDSLVTNKVLILMARKNAKTALCAAISLCHSWFDEHGAEVDFLANSAQQAAIAMEHTLHFAKSLDTKGRYFKRFRNTIKIPRTDSIIQVQSSDASTKDGFNSSLFIQDEFHSSKDWSLYNVFISSMGMRKNPCAIVISTTGFLLSGYPLYEYVQTCRRVLDNSIKDDNQFSALYQLDDTDDWTDPDVWIKSNPSLGVTVTKKYLKQQVDMAINQPSQEVGVKTKNFNCWCQSETIWLPDSLIVNNSFKIDMSKLKGEVVYGGVDLAAVSDLASISLMVAPNPERDYYPDKYLFKTWLYIPKETLDKSVNKELYKTMIKQGYAICTGGGYVDYDYILDDLLKNTKDLIVERIGADEWNATQFLNDAEAAGLPVAGFAQGIGNFNRPTKLLEILLKKGEIIIDDNPLVRWCFQNAELMTDHNENTKPRKAGKDPNKKIDAVISIIEALGTYISNPNIGFI